MDSCAMKVRLVIEKALTALLPPEDQQSTYVSKKLFGRPVRPSSDRPATARRGWLLFGPIARCLEAALLSPITATASTQ